MSDDITIDVPAEEDWVAIYAVVARAFNEDGTEAESAAERSVVEPERNLVARRDGEIVGTAGILTRQLSVPGAVVPTAHVTLVSVAPTARRRGVLTRFMRRQFEDIRAAGEPIAVLWASEGRIYQRFGYGLAARRLSVNVDTREIALNATAEGRLREAKPAEVRDTLVKVYDEAYVRRPGWSERAPRHWDYRLADLEQWRRGATTLRAVIHESDHGVGGYALWRASNNWNDRGPAGEVKIVEIVATTMDAYVALWGFLLNVDLTRTASLWHCSIDEPLQFLVNEPRRLGATVGDALWVRVIDVPAALAARRYAAEIDVVIEVTDELIPANAGRWRLTGSPESATCTPTTEPAALTCDVRALGAAYLGGTSLSALATAGLLRELTPGVLARVATAFGWHEAPSSIEVF